MIGVMGPGESAGDGVTGSALELGRRIAEEGWVVLSGGMGTGVMEAVSRGAAEAGGLTVGILPGVDESGSSGYLDVAIKTGMGSGRNNINVLSSDLIIVCGMSTGTASEVALALKAERPVVLLGADEKTANFFNQLGAGRVQTARNAEDAVRLAKRILG